MKKLILLLALLAPATGQAQNVESDPQSFYTKDAQARLLKSVTAQNRLQLSLQYASYAASCGKQLSDAEKVMLVDNIQVSQSVYERVNEATPGSSKGLSGRLVQNLNRDIAKRGCNNFGEMSRNLPKVAGFSQRNLVARENPGYVAPAAPTIDQSNAYLSKLAKLK